MDTECGDEYGAASLLGPPNSTPCSRRPPDRRARHTFREPHVHNRTATIERPFLTFSPWPLTLMIPLLSVASRTYDAGGGSGGRAEFGIARFHAVIWCIAAVFVIIPWAAGVFGPAGAWCWIDARLGRRAQAARLLCFYLPTWSVVTYEVVVYLRVISKLRALTRLAEATRAVRADMRREEQARATARAGIDGPRTDITGGSESGAGYLGSPGGATAGADDGGMGRAGDSVDAAERKLRRLLYRVGAYPLILIVAWFWPTVNRVTNWFYDGDAAGDHYWLYVLMALGMSTQGISNMVAYGLSPKVREYAVQCAEQSWCCAVRGKGSAAAGLKGIAREMEMGSRGSAADASRRIGTTIHCGEGRKGGRDDNPSTAATSGVENNATESDGELLLEIDLSSQD